MSIIEEIKALQERMTPPRRILVCAAGRGDGIRAAIEARLAVEEVPLVAGALRRIEVRESDLCEGDQCYLFPHPEDALKALPASPDDGLVRGLSMSRTDVESWPDWFRRQYRFYVALSDLWFALADHPLFRRYAPLRRTFESRALLALWSAAQVEKEVLELLST